MNRFFTFILVFAVSIGALAEKTTRPAVKLKDYSGAYKHNIRKANTPSPLEGTWRFQFGDFYYEESEMASVQGDYEAGYYNNIYYFEDESMEFLPMAASFNEETNTLIFNAGYFGDFGGYGILVQHPAFYDSDEHKFLQSAVTATFDPATKKITFPANSGMTWWLYDYDYRTPIMEIWGYTFEGATKIADADFDPDYSAHHIVINKGKENETTVNFRDFSRIDFSDGNMVLNTEDGLTIPLADLATIHFEVSDEPLSVESPVEKTVKLTCQKGWLAISGLSGETTLDIYSLNGTKVMSVKPYDGRPVDISGLAEGVYVVRADKHSFKVIK